jgi:hypothetical protein
MFYAAMLTKESHHNGPIETSDIVTVVAGKLPRELPK